MSLFYIVAAGPSYIDITEKEWDYLKDKHTLTFARVPYGSRKFEYYMSIERDYLDKSVLTYMAKLGYLDTRLLLSIPESIRLARELGFEHIRQIFKQTFYFMPSRSPWFVDEPNPPHSFDECIAHSFHQPIFRFRGQLTAAINSALILGATEIRLAGVDLNHQRNFYQYEDVLRRLCKDEDTITDYLEFDKEAYKSDMNEKIRKYPEFNADTMHSTNIPICEEERWGKQQLRGISDVIEWMNKSLKESNLEGIFITNKNSILYKNNKLKYKSIEEI